MNQPQYNWKAPLVWAATSVSIAITACSGGGGGGGAIDPSDAQAVTEALTVKIGDAVAAMVAGELPPTSTEDGAPSATATESTKAEAGTSLDILVQTSTSADAALSALFAKIPGASDYFQIELDGADSKRAFRGKAATELLLNVALPENLADGEFCLDIKVADEQGLVSNAATACIEVDSSDDGGAVVDALQGTWYFACNAGDGESFSGSIVVSGNDIALTESKFEGNTNCSGSPSADSPYTESLTFEVGEQTTASDGNPAFELDIENLTEGGTTYHIVRVGADSFQLSEGSESSDSRPVSFTTAARFTREQSSNTPDGFTNAFVSGRVFYLASNSTIRGGASDLQQLSFRTDGSGSTLFAPREFNDFSTGDSNSLTWTVAADGKLRFTESGFEGTIYDWVLTPGEVGEDSATFSFTVARDGVNVESGSGTMTSADSDLYEFLSGKTFTVEATTSDLNRLVFDPEGTGSIRFPPSEFNDFSDDDVVGIHWEARSATELRFVELGGDGFNRDETGCESDPDVDCEFFFYDWVFTFSAISGNTASFDFSVTLNGQTLSGTGTLQQQ